MSSSEASRKWGTIGVVIVGALLLGGLIAGGTLLYRTLYSPSAFVGQYLSLLSEKRAADAMLVPGVGLDPGALAEAGVTAQISDALLRQAALADLSDVQILSETADDGVWTVEVSYVASGVPGQTSFEVEQAGWYGFIPHWKFATPPIAAVELVVRGSNDFAVNGFKIDRRQIAGVESDPLDPVALLVLTPGMYAVTVDNAISYAESVPTLVSEPLSVSAVTVQASPTEQFTALAQQRVNEFLDACATQQVLQPTGCPFGFQISNRLASLPDWSITEYPEVTLDPSGANWEILPASAVAHLAVDVQSIFDGSIYPLRESVRFQIAGTATVLNDGSVSLRVRAP